MKIYLHYLFCFNPELQTFTIQSHQQRGLQCTACSSWLHESIWTCCSYWSNSISDIIKKILDSFQGTIRYKICGWRTPLVEEINVNYLFLNHFTLFFAKKYSFKVKGFSKLRTNYQTQVRLIAVEICTIKHFKQGRWTKILRKRKKVGLIMIIF